MITVYSTAYYGPTDNSGSRIKVTNTRTGNSRWHHWNYAVDGGLDQHEHAVRECSVASFRAVRYGGETDKGYLLVATTNGEEE